MHPSPLPRSPIRKPRLRRTFTLLPMPDGGLQLRAGDERIVLLESDTLGDVLPQLLDRLDGNTTVEDLVHAFAGTLCESDIRTVIDELEAKGLLEDGVDWPGDLTPAETEIATYLVNFGYPACRARDVLRSLRVAVIGQEAFTHVMIEILAEHGIPCGVGIAPEDHSWQTAVRGAHLLVYVESDASSFALEQLNPYCLAESLPWLYVSMASGHHGALGPLYVPPDTGCHACYCQRLRLNTSAPGEFEALNAHLRNGGKVASFGALPAHRAHMAYLAAIEILKHVLRFRSCNLYNRTLTVDFLDFSILDEPVWRDPVCPACQPRKA